MHINNGSNSQSWPRQPPPTNQRQPLHPPQFVDPFVMQHLMQWQDNTTPRCDGSTPMHHFCGSPIRDELVYQGMAQQHQHQYRAPTSGPSYNQHSKGFHKAEAQYKDQYNMYHQGRSLADHSTDIHQVDARMSGSYITGSSEAWRPPSRNPSMADHNSTQQMQKTRYNRDRSSRTRRSRTDNVDVSAYEIPMESKSGSDIPAPLPPTMVSTWAPAPSQSTSTRASAASTLAYPKTNAQNRTEPDEQ